MILCHVLYGKRRRGQTEGLSYITSFYSYAIVGITMEWVENGMPEYRRNLLKTVSETFETTIDVMIKDYIVHNIK